MTSCPLSRLFFCGSLLVALVGSTPVSPSWHLKRDPPLAARDDPLGGIAALPPDSISQPGMLSSNLTVISDAIASHQAGRPEVVSAYKSIFEAVKPASTPTTIQDILAIMEDEYTGSTSSLIDSAASLYLHGLDPGNVKVSLAKRGGIDIDSTDNSNPEPPTTIYPQSSSADPSYSILEKALRSAIYIPSAFEFGRGSKQTVILVPGTAVPGGTTYKGNFAKLLSSTTWADPLWLNIPGFSLGDIQANAEYVAYAIHYISAITGGRNVSVITWSQGSLDTQWGLKYWPSTRGLVSDHIAVSGDYHGTKLAYTLCPGFPLNMLLGCTPSILQQTYDSNLIRKLRSSGGDSAYIPTTTIYSGTDEIVQPQSGSGASSFLNDARTVGVSNNQVQVVCGPGSLAGGFYGHAGVLIHPLAWELTVDALQHPGPGQVSRLNVPNVCRTPAANGLTAGDVLLTEAMTVTGALNALAYSPRVDSEPAFKPYVT
ncbi:hypothetical protein FGG08_000508 [Glutinoglossum americanum]|uniref:Lipase B n=1 Tax=Glutinoglossum americanum TaxID=1670608 RepID=A0A9P8L6T1_9PEZI|nr:hypothetical protein FGG08_000508 [Glutinoglossum americanum]